MATDKNKFLEQYILPSKYSDLEVFTKHFKTEMIEHVFRSIEIAIEQNIPIIEVFQFKNSNFVITLGKNDYFTNLENIFSYFLENEKYEYCNKLIALQKTLKEKSEINNDEKEKR